MDEADERGMTLDEEIEVVRGWIKGLETYELPLIYNPFMDAWQGRIAARDFFAQRLEWLLERKTKGEPIVRPLVQNIVWSRTNVRHGVLIGGANDFEPDAAHGNARPGCGGCRRARGQTARPGAPHVRRVAERARNQGQGSGTR